MRRKVLAHAVRHMRADRRSLSETRSHLWAELRLGHQVVALRAKRARRQLVALVALLVGALAVYHYRAHIFGLQRPIRILTVIALVILGWAFARDLGRALAPLLLRRMDAGTAGTVSFLIRLATLGSAVFAALRIAGVQTQTLAVGGALTAVILGLAAQQTLGHLIAGTILLSARPFRVGDRVRLQAGALAGTVEGVVSSLGLLYTTFTVGESEIMVPNSLVLNSAIVPLREPDAVDLKARIPAGMGPTEVERLIREGLSVATRSAPAITLEEVDGDEVIVRISAVPLNGAEAPRLADEILTAVGRANRSDHAADGDPPATPQAPA